MSLRSLFQFQTAYRDLIRQPKPIFYARLAEKSGIAPFDESGRVVGTFGPNSSGNWTGGRLNYASAIPADTDDAAAFFDGTGYATFGNPFTLGTDYSVGAWIYPTTVSGAVVMVGFRSTSASNPIAIQLDRNGADVRLIVRDDAGNIAVASFSSALRTNEWFFVEGTRNGPDLNIFVNGEKGTPASAVFGTITANLLVIGGSVVGTGSTPSVLFTGTIDEVDIVATTLNQRTIRERYRVGLNRREVRKPVKAIAAFIGRILRSLILNSRIIEPAA